MSANQNPIPDKIEWDPIRERVPSKEFVNRYLSSRGLKSLTDGKIYYLNPPEGGDKLALPKLVELPEKIVARKIHVSISRLQEVDKGTKGSPEISESIMNRPAKECQYWEFFLEQKKSGRFFIAIESYLKKPRIRIDWCEPQEKEEEETPFADFIAYDAQPSAATMVGAVKSKKISSNEMAHVLNNKREDLQNGSSTIRKTPGEIDNFFHVTREYQSVFDSNNHTFIIIGDKAFLCTNLIELLGAPRNLTKLINAEKSFQMPV